MTPLPLPYLAAAAAAAAASVTLQDVLMRRLTDIYVRSLTEKSIDDRHWTSLDDANLLNDERDAAVVACTWSRCPPPGVSRCMRQRNGNALGLAPSTTTRRQPHAVWHICRILVPTIQREYACNNKWLDRRYTTMCLTKRSTTFGLLQLQHFDNLWGKCYWGSTAIRRRFLALCYNAFAPSGETGNPKNASFQLKAHVAFLYCYLYWWITIKERFKLSPGPPFALDSKSDRLHHVPHSTQSTGLRSGLFGGQKSRGMNLSVSRCLKIVKRALSVLSN